MASTSLALGAPATGKFVRASGTSGHSGYPATNSGRTGAITANDYIAVDRYYSSDDLLLEHSAFIPVSSLLADSFVAYTPSVAAASGTLGSASAVGAYRELGKIVFFRATATITTNGTGATAVRFGLPIAAVGSHHFVHGYSIQNSEIPCFGRFGNGATTVDVKWYTGNYPGSNGEVIAISGFYEIA